MAKSNPILRLRSHVPSGALFSDNFKEILRTSLVSVSILKKCCCVKNLVVNGQGPTWGHRYPLISWLCNRESNVYISSLGSCVSLTIPTSYSHQRFVKAKSHKVLVKKLNLKIQFIGYSRNTHCSSPFNPQLSHGQIKGYRYRGQNGEEESWELTQWDSEYMLSCPMLFLVTDCNHMH